MTGLPFPLPLALLSLALAPSHPGPTPPASCPALEVARRPCAPPPAPPDAPATDGPWLDCYVACVEAQWRRCVEQCGGYDPTTNPCLAICYDAISLGCAIGCTRWGLVPNTVEGATP